MKKTLASVFILLILSAVLASCGDSDKAEEYVYPTADDYKSTSSTVYHSDETPAVPYIGMSESRISDTELGAPSEKVRHNYAMISNERFHANLYDFYNEDGAKIFTARCADGRVIDIFDHRDEPITARAPYTGTTGYEDPYNVNDYIHPEDFYYDHYDDFFDFYDAENYFDEHHE